MGNQNQPPVPEKEPIGKVLEEYKKMHGTNSIAPPPEAMPTSPQDAPQGASCGSNVNIQNMESAVPTAIPHNIPPATSYNPQDFEKTMSQETDPDLMTSYEIIKLPSQGRFYSSGIKEVNVEYMTSKDEDILTTPSLIENGTVLDVLLRRKIKTPGVNLEELLVGDRSAIILFLRSSSYGPIYKVQVPDPRTNVLFKTDVDLNELKYKKIAEEPDANGHFTTKLKMRKKTVTFKLLSSGEETHILKQSEAYQEASGQEFSDYSTMKLKAHIVSIDGNIDRSYINKFVDAMPAGDALNIRRKILDVSPDVDMEYEFKAKDGYKFKAQLSIGIDFFFPNT